MEDTQQPKPADVVAEVLDFREAAFLRFDTIAEHFERMEGRFDALEELTRGIYRRLRAAFGSSGK